MRDKSDKHKWTSLSVAPRKGLHIYASVDQGAKRERCLLFAEDLEYEWIVRFDHLVDELVEDSIHVCSAKCRHKPSSKTMRKLEAAILTKAKGLKVAANALAMAIRSLERAAPPLSDETKAAITAAVKADLFEMLPTTSQRSAEVH